MILLENLVSVSYVPDSILACGLDEFLACKACTFKKSFTSNCLIELWLFGSGIILFVFCLVNFSDFNYSAIFLLSILNIFYFFSWFMDGSFACIVWSSSSFFLEILFACCNFIWFWKPNISKSFFKHLPFTPRTVCTRT